MLRPVNQNEVALIERSLILGAKKTVQQELINSICSLQVTSTCKCGCATVWFGPDGESARGELLAETSGMAAGHFVQLLVWSKENSIIGVEVVGFEKEPSPLPELDSIRGEHVT